MVAEHSSWEDPIYTIGVVARLAGLTARQIRYYESVGIVSPARSQGNQRLYSKAHLALLKEVRALREEDVPLEAISKLLGTEERMTE